MGSNKNYTTGTAPISGAAPPINLIGAGTTYGTVLVASENNYIAGFKVASVGCGANLSAPAATTQGPIAGPTLAAQTQGFSTVSAPAAAAALALGTCSVTKLDTRQAV